MRLQIPYKCPAVLEFGFRIHQVRMVQSFFPEKKRIAGSHALVDFKYTTFNEFKFQFLPGTL